MNSRRVSLATAVLLLFVAAALGQDAKPNFSGDWTLDREKSDIGEGGPRGGGPRGGGPREGGPRGGPGGGRGMGMGSFSIIQEGDSMVVKRKLEFQGEERTFESRYTTDGKENVNEGFRGNSTKSKTHWEGAKLITESVMETPNGTRETKEVRSLSPDGKTMTVETTAKGGFGEGTRKLVYNKKE